MDNQAVPGRFNRNAGVGPAGEPPRQQTAERSAAEDRRRRVRVHGIKHAERAGPGRTRPDIVARLNARRARIDDYVDRDHRHGHHPRRADHKTGSVTPVGAPLVDNNPVQPSAVAQLLQTRHRALHRVVVKSSRRCGASTLPYRPGRRPGCFLPHACSRRRRAAGVRERHRRRRPAIPTCCSRRLTLREGSDQLSKPAGSRT